MKGLILLIFVTLFISCQTKYYFVRHAEKANNTDDPPLSAAGNTRANVLRDSLINKGIDSIFVSEKIRTQQTARPLAISRSITPREINKDNINAYVTALERISGKDILVVGHTTNLPGIISGVLGKPMNEISESVFDSMYVVTKKKCFKVTHSLKRLRYDPPNNP